ncbi:hypothetical protein HA48_15825 [Pantoea wallisii]|uniref:YetF C-terminal domain-containing protein n=1 Tax=Pantoea wallisii TaxID=1076551 RepID=A0A1X1D443_9GAMM|nr:YetF domain-containing protein [Pantoea wallisii]ORM71448.1 hypothetical protein HA48_15825 [Pantoea wallisii]
METVLRAAGIYLVLMVVFKIAGRRALLQMTSFDLILLLIISEATQQALLGDDFSVTGAALTIITLVAIDIVLGKLKNRFPTIEQMAEGGPVILVEHGNALHQRMKMTGISQDDVLEAARSQGLERLEQIKYAVLEVNGHISIIPVK